MDCDGHGWVTISDARDRHVVARCPDCPSGIRVHVIDDCLDEDPGF